MPMTKPTSEQVTFLAAGSGASQRTVLDKLRDVVSVKDFGAVGDGVADDTAAIQAAITFCENNNKALRIPANVTSQYYKTTAPLLISKPLAVIGDGSRSTLIWATGLTAGQFALDVDGTSFGTFEDGIIAGISIRAGSGNAMRIKNVSRSYFHDIGLRQSANGITYTGTRCFGNSFNGLNNVTGMSGTMVLMDSHTGGGHHEFSNCTFGGTTGVSVTASTVTDNISFFTCNFEQCTSFGLNVEGTVNGLAVVGCRTEGGDTADFNIRPATATDVVSGLSICGSVFAASDSGASNRIVLGGASGIVRGFQICGNAVTHGTNTFAANLVQLNGDGESGIISGNRVAGTTATGAGVVNAKRAGVVVFGNENLSGKLDEAWGNLTWSVVQTTWTPTDGSGAGLVLTASGRYTRIGPLIMWQAEIVYPATADASTAEIGGLPFPVAGSGGAGRAGGVVNYTDAGLNLGISQGITSSNEFRFVDRNAATNVTNAQLSGRSIYCSGCYTV